MSAPEYIEREPSELPPTTHAHMRIDILAYAAIDSENAPPKLRGMAMALIDGKLLPIYHAAATAEEAAQSLREFLEAEVERHRGAKPRGRPKGPRKLIEGAVGADPVSLDDGDEII